MPIPSAELVLFAAQAWIRLVRSGHRACVEAKVGGKAVNGNPRRYVDADGLFFWCGGVRPVVS